jgi:hypothetical protein
LFGKKRRLEKMLAEGRGRRAYAVVLKATKIVPGSGGGYGGVGTSGGGYRVHARVEPEGEPSFEAAFNMYAQLDPAIPHESQRIPVFYDPEDPGEVIWDRQTALADSAAKSAYDRERRDRIRAERAAQGLAPIEATQGPDPDIEAKLRALQERKDRGELTDWEFRVARSEIFKEVGF